MWIIVLLLAIFAILYSIRNLWKSSETNSFFSLSNLMLLSLVYSTVLIAFGLGYLVLGEIGLPVLKEHANASIVSPRGTVGTAMYFSAITLFSVGYGDITPIGIGRAIAVIEALIGYILPFAFVARVVTEHDKRD